MLKKSFLTPVLSGVLAVTVVGSGVGYYFEFVKDDSSASDKDGGSQTITVDTAAQAIEDQLDKVEKIANGELEEGYKAQLTYSAPDSITNELGVALSDITIGMEAKQKDKMSGVDITLDYDSQTLLTLNTVYDNDSQTAYIKIPELSDDYLTTTTDSLSALAQDYVDEMGVDVESASGDADEMIDSLSQIDMTALLEDIESYEDVVKENIPEATAGDDYTVSSGDASITLTTECYTVTSTDAYNLMAAIAEKGVDDQTLKDAALALGMTEDEYDSMWATLCDDIDTSDTAALSVDVYYYGDDFAGFSLSDGEEAYYAIAASDDTSMIIDMDLSDGSDGFTANGALTLEDGLINGSVDMGVMVSDSDVTSSTGGSTSLTLEFDNLEATEEVLNGKITCSVTSADTTIDMVCSFDNKEDDIDTSLSLSMDGESLGSISLTAQETNASDISVPTGTGYELTDDTALEAYMEGLNLDSWLTNVQTALGDELYTALFGSLTGESYSDYDYDYDDYDYSYDYDDYDYDYDYDI
ncbi:MAG: hypothetical protein LUI06_03370 [Ruminococcus sp.]|nr:hypothetical protein [Ruminococcus sp.]